MIRKLTNRGQWGIIEVMEEIKPQIKPQIKSQDRVKGLAEVYTAEREVKAMCDLIPAEVWQKLDATFLEPACGDGNFMEEILKRKLRLVPNTIPKRRPQSKIEFMILVAVSSIYGIDIDSQNVEEARARLLGIAEHGCEARLRSVKPSQKFEELLRLILKSNIQEANTLNPQGLCITEWQRPQEGTFVQQIHRFSNILTPLYVDKPLRKGKTFQVY